MSQLSGVNSRLELLEAHVATPRDLRITDLYREGVPVAEIGERTGVCVKTVRNVARRHGLPPRHPPQPERDAEVARRYRLGEPVAEIAADCGVSRPRVRFIAAQAGLPPRKGWQRRYPLDESVFDRPSEVGWWLVGLLAADGSINESENRVSLCQTIEDADVLRAFYAYVGCPNRPLTMLNMSDQARRRQLPRRPAAEARVFSKRLVVALARHGVVPRKSATLTLSSEAAKHPAVWLGLLDGDGSVGIYRGGRTPRLMFSGAGGVMQQCEEFWRRFLGRSKLRATARPHSGGIWTFSLWGTGARAAAKVLLASSPVSMRRKRAVLAHIAGSSPEELLCAFPKRDKVSRERRNH